MNERVAASGRHSDEWLRLAEEALGAGFWTWSPGGKVNCSPGLYAITGVNPVGVQLDLVFMETLVHPKDALAMEDNSGLAMDHRQTNRTFRLIRPDGQLRWLKSRASVIFDRAGDVIRVAAVVADITEQHNVRRRADSQRALLFAVSRILEAGLWIADESGQLVAKYETEGGVQLANLNSGIQGWQSLMHPDDLPRVPPAWQAAVRAQSLYSMSARMKSGSGDYELVHIAGVPLAQEHGSDALWGGITTRDAQQLAPSVGYKDTPGLLLTPGQVRACRALLDWTAEMLADRAAISISTIRRIERGSSQGQGDSLRLVMIAFQEAGLRLWRGDDGRFCISDIG